MAVKFTPGEKKLLKHRFGGKSASEIRKELKKDGVAPERITAIIAAVSAKDSSKTTNAQKQAELAKNMPKNLMDAVEKSSGVTNMSKRMENVEKEKRASEKRMRAESKERKTMADAGPDAVIKKAPVPSKASTGRKDHPTKPRKKATSTTVIEDKKAKKGFPAGDPYRHDQFGARIARKLGDKRSVGEMTKTRKKNQAFWDENGPDK